MSTLSLAALEIAKTQIGKEEIPRGSNWGADVKGYLASVGIGFPASWCMALMYWCFDKAAREAGVGNPLYKTGGVLAQYNNRHQNVVMQPQPGDIMILDYGGGLGHTGIVESVEGDKVHTIEGNSNSDGGREGYAVVRHVRLISKAKAYLRF